MHAGKLRNAAARSRASGDWGAGRLRPLSRQRAALVEKNIRLVSVHIRRNVPRTARGRVTRDVDDLFQEGCCGLIDAAQRFNPRSGIKFAAYALPRIRRAINQALAASGTIASPRKVRDRPAHGSAGATRPRVLPLTFDPADGRSRPDPDAGESDRTIGDRIREKYEMGLRVAVRRELASGLCSRKLVRRISEHRCRVPEPLDREPLRSIAQATGCSESRAARCSRRMERSIRSVLGSDAETRRLAMVCRRDPDGTSGVITSEIGGDLRRAGAASFVAALHGANRAVRTRILAQMVRDLGEPTAQVIGRMFVALKPEQADRYVERLLDEARTGGRPRRRRDAQLGAARVSQTSAP